MDIPETLLTLGAQDEDKQNTTHKTKNMNPTENPGAREGLAVPATYRGGSRGSS